MKPARTWDVHGGNFCNTDTVELDDDLHPVPEDDPLDFKIDVAAMKIETPESYDGTTSLDDIGRERSQVTVDSVKYESRDVKEESPEETPPRLEQFVDSLQEMQVHANNDTSLNVERDPLTLKDEKDFTDIKEESASTQRKQVSHSSASIDREVPRTCLSSKPELPVDIANDVKMSRVSVASSKRSRKRTNLPSDTIFSCALCGKTFPQKVLIRQHIQFHVRPYQCEFCPHASASLFLLRTHILRHLGTPLQLIKRHKCTLCDKTFVAKARLRDHLIMHSGVSKHWCDVCHTSHKTVQMFQQHMQIHEKAFHCAICDRTFARKSLIRTHIQVHVAVYNYRCKICRKSFTSKQSFTRHKGVHTKAFQCHVCDRLFSNKDGLDGHIQKHLGTERFRCEICNMGFSKLHSYKRHGDTHDLPFVCHICGKRVSRQALLDNHLKVAHSGKRDIACEYCDKRFATQHNCNVHMYVHTRPYKCKECDMSFSKRDSLEAHSQTHSKRKHKCDYCDGTYATAARLKQHVRNIHTRAAINCFVCHKQIWYSIKEHMKTHDDMRQKDVPCSICTKLFYSKSDLRKHMVSHVKPVVSILCAICKKVFMYKTSLKKHVMKFHF